MMIPFQNESPAMQLNTQDAGAELIFVGNHCNFSGCLITTTIQELGGITSAAMTSFHDFRSMIEATRANPGAVVLDEPTMRGLSDSDRSFLLGLNGSSLGVAFSSLEFGMACHADPTLRHRSTSIFPLNVRLDVWLSIIKLIVHGGNYVCPEVITPRLVEERAEPAADDTGLTQRQMDVLRLVADGQSNKRIADALGLSIHTVKLHLHNGSQRLGARNRTEAAMRYREFHL
ncbi:response regulator transcription factor [Paracoccus aestuariivivens]|nr:response regulator transcription factor [Paracoccus aestuariivivens]